MITTSSEITDKIFHKTIFKFGEIDKLISARLVFLNFEYERKHVSTCFMIMDNI